MIKYFICCTGTYKVQPLSSEHLVNANEHLVAILIQLMGIKIRNDICAFDFRASLFKIGNFEKAKV